MKCRTLGNELSVCECSGDEVQVSEGNELRDEKSCSVLTSCDDCVWSLLVSNQHCKITDCELV